MHIGLLIYGSLDTVSGGYLYDRRLVEHLRAAGDEVEIVSLPWRNYAQHLTDNANQELLRRLQTASFDVLLQDELNHPSLFRLNRKLRGRYPLVSIVHHLRSSERRPRWQNALYRLVERRYLRSVDGFVFNSRTTRAAVADLLGRTPASLVAYPAGNRYAAALTPEQIQARAHQTGPLRLLFLGNVIPRKGLHTLIAALAQLPSDAWELNVVGGLDVEPGYVRRLQGQSAQAGLQTRIYWRGALTEAALRAQLEHNQALAVPSSYEGFGIAYLEGMAFGLPAIATTAGAAGEIITHGTDGFLVPPEDPAALARVVRVWIEDRARLRAMGLAAQQRFLRHPTWTESMAAVRAFLASAHFASA
jgi:glycosyltransferase involved in cell wall biosynthesis